MEIKDEGTKEWNAEYQDLLEKFSLISDEGTYKDVKFLFCFLIYFNSSFNISSSSFCFCCSFFSLFSQSNNLSGAYTRYNTREVAMKLAMLETDFLTKADAYGRFFLFLFLFFFFLLCLLLLLFFFLHFLLFCSSCS